jgi:hypothetical protein
VFVRSVSVEVEAASKQGHLANQFDATILHLNRYHRHRHGLTVIDLLLIS